MAQGYKYRAFISYSHEDEKWAKWLHAGLERYRVPRRIVDSENLSTGRLTPIFRDRDELASAASLSESIQHALQESEFLIVIGSPSAANSQWVNAETKQFIEMGRADRVLCLIVDGEPPDCFPDVLKLQEPLASDVRPQGDGRNDAKLKIISGLLKIPFGMLHDRELRRKHRRLVGISSASIALSLVLIGLTTFALLARDQAMVQQVLAAKANDEAQTVTDFLSNMLTEADPEAMGKTIIADFRMQAKHVDLPDPFPAALLKNINSTDTAREILHRHVLKGAAETARTEFADQPSVNARILEAIGNSYLAIGLYDDAAELLSRSVALYQSTIGDRSDRTLSAQTLLGLVYMQQGRLEEAESTLREVLEIRRAVFGASHLGTIDAMNTLAMVYSDVRRLEEARTLLEEAVSGMVELVGGEDEKTLEVTGNLGWVLYLLEEYQEAEKLTTQVLAAKRRVLGSEHVETMISLNNLALIYRRLGRLDKAEAIHREEWTISKRVLGDDHPEVIVSMLNLARVLTDLKRFDEAESLLSDANNKAAVVLLDNHPLRAALLFARGESHRAAGDHASAKADYMQARGIYIFLFGPEDPHIPTLDSKLAEVAQSERH